MDLVQSTPTTRSRLTGDRLAPPPTTPVSLVVGNEWDQETYRELQEKLRAYNRLAAPSMEPPEARPLNIRVEDENGALVGGIAAVTYWGWMVIKLMVLDESQRHNGLGLRLLRLAHQEARARGCQRVQTMTYDFQAKQFYIKEGYRVVGELEDYPEGFSYYWLRIDFEDEDWIETATDQIAPARRKH